MPYFSLGNIKSKVENYANDDLNDVKFEEYFSTCKLSKLASTLSKTIFFILRFNVRSLLKNKDRVEEFFDGMTKLLDIFAISETKLNSNSVSNVNIPNYTFLRRDSPTSAAGVGLYIIKTTCNIA